MKETGNNETNIKYSVKRTELNHGGVVDQV